MFHRTAYVWADNSFFVLFFFLRWSGGAKVSCILRHWGVQLILAYSWARPVILVAGKGRGNVFISSVSPLSFLFLFLPCPSLSSLLLSLLSLFSFSGRRNKMTHKGWGVVKPQHRRSRVQPLPRSATFFRRDWSWNIFYSHLLPSADSRRTVFSFWQKNVHNTG